MFDGGLSLVTIFLFDKSEFVFNYLELELSAFEDLFQVGDKVMELFKFVHNLLNFESGELSESVCHYCSSLRVVESILFHKGDLCLA